MSQENVVAVEAAFGALASGGVTAFTEHWADDLDHRAIEGAPDDRGPIHGKDALRSYLNDWFETFDDFVVELIDLIDVGGDQVVAVLRFSGRAKLSGVSTDQTLAIVFTISDGKLARGREYGSREQALEAAGLSE